ncbi:MAG: gamma-glutamyltransferase, partial [Planctomycetota bacterium]
MSSPPPPGAPGRPSCRFAPLGVALLGAALLAGAGCGARDTFDDPVAATLPAVGAVVTEHPLATKAGLLVLEAGGNAADAAVAAALTLAVVFPQAGNLGGGGFAVWVPHRGAPETLDFRETAPSGYTADLYLDERGEVMPERSLTTPLAVGVPGSPHGLFELYRRHGTKRDLSFARLCDSAIRLAEDGFGVDPWLADTLATPYIRERLAGDPGARAMFYPGGEPLGVGDRLKQPALARTLRLLASRGASGFYRGPIAEAIVADLVEADARAGGVAGTALLSASDLAGYSVKVRRPVVGIFRGHTVYGMAPPASGGVALLQMLGMLEGLPLDAARRDARERVELGLDEPLRVDPVGRTGGDDGPLDWTGIDARTLHWWIEAMRRAFADRAEHLGDPDQFPVPTAELLSPEWIAQQRISISERADLGVRPWVRSPAEGASETTHISVIDSDGNAVSLTTTLNGNFGSGIYVEEAGFFLNNELDDFSIQSGTPNMYGLVGSDANQLTPL